MTFLDMLFRRKPKAEIIESKPENVESKLEIRDKSEEILKELKLIYAFLINHDQKLDRHSDNVSEYLTTLLMQRKVISPEKVNETKQIIQEAIRNGLSKSETVDKLRNVGIPRSSAYKLVKNLQSKELDNRESITETID